MKREIITISDSGTVTIPNKDVRMTICEIADLFGIFYQTAKREIRAIEKSGIASGDYSMNCIVAGLNVCPEYYGLEMVITLAFRVQSEKAKMFRQWIIRKAAKQNSSATIVLTTKNTNIFN